MNHLTVGAVQMESALGDTRTNARALCAWLQQGASAGARLVVFPECCLTGFTCDDPMEAAISREDDRVREVLACAKGLGVAVGFGFIERAEDASRPFNAYLVSDGQMQLVYRKTHLGKVEGAFVPGDVLPVESIADVRIGVQLCWEAHIPDISSTLRAEGAQLLLCPHAVGTPAPRRLELWNRYLPARALDNGVFVVACNALRNGADGRTGGGVAAWSPDGSLMGVYDGADEHMEIFAIGGLLPPESSGTGMGSVSYYERRRPELYR